MATLPAVVPFSRMRSRDVLGRSVSLVFAQARPRPGRPCSNVFRAPCTRRGHARDWPSYSELDPGRKADRHILVLFEPAQLALSDAIVLAEAAPAQTSPAPVAPASAQRVSVAIAGAQADTARLSLALADAMRRLGIGVELRRNATSFVQGDGSSRALSPPEPGETPMTARLWIDLSERESVTLYVADDQRERVFVRRFDTPSGVDEVALEQLVLAVSSSVEAVRAGHLIGVARREYEASLQSEKPQLAPSVATVEPPHPSFGSLSWAYGASWLGPGALVHGPALGLELERLRWGVGLWVLGRLPVQVGTDDASSVEVRLTTVGFRYRVWLALPLSERVSLLPGLGVGGDFTQVSPRGSKIDALLVAEPRWAADGMLQGLVGVAYRTPSWSLTGAIGADVSVQPVRYALEVSSGVSDVFVPFRARPFIELQVAATVLP